MDLAKRSGGPVLELGSGTGRVAFAIAREGFNGWERLLTEARLLWLYLFKTVLGMPARSSPESVAAVQQIRTAIQTVIRTGFQAGSAANTAITDPLNLGTPGYAFRIMAPAAAQRASLEEHGGPDIGAVMQCIALDVEKNW